MTMCRGTSRHLLTITWHCWNRLYHSVTASKNLSRYESFNCKIWLCSLVKWLSVTSRLAEGLGKVPPTEAFLCSATQCAFSSRLSPRTEDRSVPVVIPWCDLTMYCALSARPLLSADLSPRTGCYKLTLLILYNRLSGCGFVQPIKELLSAAGRCAGRGCA